MEEAVEDEEEGEGTTSSDSEDDTESAIDVGQTESRMSRGPTPAPREVSVVPLEQPSLSEEHLNKMNEFEK